VTGIYSVKFYVSNNLGNLLLHYRLRPEMLGNREKSMQEIEDKIHKRCQVHFPSVLAARITLEKQSLIYPLCRKSNIP
jgi:hypothetical protein